MSILNVNKINPVGGGSTVTIAGIASVTGNVTASEFHGDGSNLTNLPAQATISNNADNRVITGGSGVNLNGESGLTFSSNTLSINTNGSSFAENNVRFQPPGKAYIDHATTGQDIDIRTSVSSSLDTTGITIKSNGNLAFASGKGINFHPQGGSNVNLLSDYEEGTWTPTCTVSGGGSWPSSATAGYYTKVGNIVHVQFRYENFTNQYTTVKGSASGSTPLAMGGLPFQVQHYLYTPHIATWGGNYNGSLSDATASLYLFVPDSATTMTPYFVRDNATGLQVTADFLGQAYIRGQFSYQTTS